MELVALLRVLWRLRLVVALGGVVAVGLGFMATKGATHLGVATTRVLLDTPTSQTVDATPPGVSTLQWRAGLLSDLMATDEMRLSIARAMGIDGDSLVVSAPYMSMPAVAIPLPRVALDAAAAVPHPYTLAIQAQNWLPIVAIDAQAPSRALATKLAVVAAQAMKAAATTDATPTASAGVLKFVVGDVGPVHSREILNRPRRIFAVIVAVFVFGIWCAAITLIAGFSRGRRAALKTQTAGVASTY